MKIFNGKEATILKTPRDQYEKRQNYFQQQLANQTKIFNFLSNLRLLVFVLGVGLAIFLYLNQGKHSSWVALLVTVVAFAVLVKKHAQAAKGKQRFAVLCEINSDALKRLNGEWKSFPDTGEEFQNQEHPYTNDLDIFGKASLFQWINTASTYLGRHRLKELLATPAQSTTEILSRQEVVQELAGKLEWRQNLNAEGMMISDKMRDPQSLFSWATDKNKFYFTKWVRILARVLPIPTVTLIAWYLLSQGTTYYLPLAAVGVQALLLQLDKKARTRALNSVYNFKNSIKIYREMLQLFENENFKSKYLKELQRKIRYGGKERAYLQLDSLERIAEWVSSRDNMLYSIVNLITLWDFQCMIALEDWKRKSGSLLKDWLQVLGELEALASLAVIRFDHPDWAMPHLQEGEHVLSAQAMGHPLLTEQRVCNDLSMVKPATILLITGSNMSGKSTLLRTAGINLVLAYAGAPVCAKEFSCSIMQIYTSMRVGDDLENNISSFYAELLRIKRVVEAAKAGEQVFFLLDEIFKGTNSMDRHTGAKLLIQQLGKQGALGLVSTHDLELGELEKESGGKIKNYHFREYYEDDEIRFDYKLRRGISTTRNALYLIKLAGIEVSEKS